MTERAWAVLVIKGFGLWLAIRAVTAWIAAIQMAQWQARMSEQFGYSQISMTRDGNPVGSIWIFYVVAIVYTALAAYLLFLSEHLVRFFVRHMANDQTRNTPVDTSSIGGG